jgi:hypothetical protein
MSRIPAALRGPIAILVVGALLLLAFIMATYGPVQGPKDLVTGVLSTMLTPFLRASTRADVSMVKSDMRSMGTAIEAYYVDQNACPAMAPLADYSLDRSRSERVGGGGLSTWYPGGPFVSGLTTPVAYLDTIRIDPYTNDPRPRLFYRHRWFTQSSDNGIAPFAYHADGGRWILFSCGPDRDYDVDPVADYITPPQVPSDRLVMHTYDPTNGTASGGDVWRVKQ